MRYYLGRNYEVNKNDCLSLVCEYYNKEFGVSINKPEYKTPEDIYKYTINDIQEDGLKPIPLEKIKSGDILIYTLKNKKNLYHLGIFFKPNKMLHIEKDGISKYEDISDFYWKRLSVILTRGNNV